MNFRKISAALGCLAGILFLGGHLAFPRPCRPDLIPNGHLNSCHNCHSLRQNPDDYQRTNAFGQFLLTQGHVQIGQCNEFWGPSVASEDPDFDGYTNGEELQDPEGNWRAGDGPIGNVDLVSNPGFIDSTPPPTFPPATLTPTSTPIPPTFTPIPPSPTPIPTPTANADLNGDGKVDKIDLLILMHQWYRTQGLPMGE